jgi:hypothetical protein
VRGAVAGLSAMKVTCSRQARSMLAAADDAPAVGEEDDLEQHGRRVGGCAGEVVLVAGVEAGQVELVIDQVVQGVFEGAGQQLPFEIDGKEARAGVDCL